jgi:hypothetical protein
MNIRSCPQCGFANPENEWGCYYCGATLSQTKVVDDGTQTPEKIELLRDLHSASLIGDQLKVITELTPYARSDWDTFRYLRKLAIVAASPEVREAAAQASRGWRTRFRHIPSLKDIYRKYEELFYPPKDAREKERWVRAAHGLAVSLLMIDVFVTLGFSLNQGLHVSDFGMRILKDIILAISLLSYQSWARQLTLLTAAIWMIFPAFAVWGILLISLDSTVSLTSQVDIETILTSLMQFGLSGALLVLLNPRMTKTTLSIGIGIFGALYIVPVVISVLSILM